jgi:transcriptional regulator with XRE-family HTH domain
VAVATVRQWTGRETRLLREAMRRSIRDFAGHLGMSERTISKWEQAGEELSPRPDTQAVLDTALDQAPDDAKARFFQALGASVPAPPAPTSLSLDSHKFIPVFVGTQQAQRLRAHMGQMNDAVWLEHSTTDVRHPDASKCTLYAFACGVAVFHLVQHREPASLTDLALWRYRTYATDLPWAGDVLADVLDTAASRSLVPEYVLSLYWVIDNPWSGAERDTALRLLSTPSVLVDRSTPNGPQPLAGNVEETLLATGFDHPDPVSFGVRDISIGYAGWSGVSYTALSPERSLTIDQLVACELTVQALWCFCRQIQIRVEDGTDPAMPEQYGWRFLRAAHSRLTTARAQETAQHCLMRDAIMDTSGLADRLRAAQDALRDSVR